MEPLNTHTHTHSVLIKLFFHLEKNEWTRENKNLKTFFFLSILFACFAIFFFFCCRWLIVFFHILWATSIKKKNESFSWPFDFLSLFFLCVHSIISVCVYVNFVCMDVTMYEWMNETSHKLNESKLCLSGYFICCKMKIKIKLFMPEKKWFPCLFVIKTDQRKKKYKCHCMVNVF